MAFMLSKKQNQLYDDIYNEYKTICKFQEIPPEIMLNYSEYFTAVLERGSAQIKGNLKKGQLIQEMKNKQEKNKAL